MTVENVDQVLAEALIDAPRPAARIKAERDDRQQPGHAPASTAAQAGEKEAAVAATGAGSGDQPPAAPEGLRPAIWGRRGGCPGGR